MFNRRYSTGTTMLELMIAIAVIVILAGLAMVAVTSTSRMTSARETETLIKSLRTLELEYKIQEGKALNVLGGSSPFNWENPQDPKNEIRQLEDWVEDNQSPQIGEVGAGLEQDPPYHDRVERLVYGLYQVDQLKGMLERQGMQKFFEDSDNDGFPEIYDSWGNMIRYYNEVFFDVDRTTSNKEVTIRSDTDDIMLHESDSPSVGMFISAGPDGYFGDEDPELETGGNWDLDARIRLARKHAEDNITSLDF